jgi:hypothetical protein
VRDRVLPNLQLSLTAPRAPDITQNVQIATGSTHLTSLKSITFESFLRMRTVGGLLERLSSGVLFMCGSNAVVVPAHPTTELPLY